MAFPDTFTTERLKAERLSEAHWPELCRMHQDPVVMAHLGGVRSEAWTLGYMTRNLQHWERHGFGLWILRAQGGVEPVGRAVIRHLLVDGVDEVELGYGFYEPYWGRGLATETTKACLRVGFDILRLSSMVAVVSVENHPSRRVLEKCGLSYVRALTMEGAPCALLRVTVGSAGPIDAPLE